MLNYITIGWLTRSSDEVLASQVNSILDALTGSSIFPTPNPTLASLQALLASFNAAMAAARQGGKTATQVKNDARAALVVAMRDLGQYIDDTADGDMASLLSSKYPLVKERTPVGIQPAPANLRVRPGPVSGSLICRCDSNPVSPIYEWQSGVGATPATWQDHPPTKGSRVVLDGFTPASTISIRVRQRVPAGVSDWSTAVSIIVV